MLKLQFRDRRKEAVWLVDKSFSIGKNPSNSLMIDDASVHDFHAEILQKNNELSLYDRSNAQNILINGQPCKGQSALKVGDVIKLGTVELELIDPKNAAGEQLNPGQSSGWTISSSASWLQQSSYPITGKTVIGRDPGCDIHIALDHLSRRHIELDIRSGQLVLKDLDSANGTYVNGSKVSEATLKTGDKIKLDVLTFEVNGPAHDPHKTIIRTAPPASTKIPEQSSISKPAPAQSKTQPQPQSAARAKTSNDDKKLVAEGKQAWLSQESGVSDSNMRKRGNQSRTGLMLLILSGILAVISTAVLISRYL